MSANPKTLVLASGSPRRAELLRQVGVDFDVVLPRVEEVHREGESPQDYVQRLALEKARCVQSRLAGRASWVLAADTIGVCANRILEKPLDKADYESMMRAMSGNEHLVLTGVALVGPDGVDVQQEFSRAVETVVTFRALQDAHIDTYWGTGEPQDKAGGYGIQGMGAMLVAGIRGSYSNVVGLPLETVAELFDEVGLNYWQDPAE